MPINRVASKLLKEDLFVLVRLTHHINTKIHSSNREANSFITHKISHFMHSFRINISHLIA